MENQTKAGNLRDGRAMSLYRDGTFRPHTPPAPGQPGGGGGAGGKDDRWKEMAAVQALDAAGRLYLFTGDYGRYNGIYSANQTAGPTVGLPGH